VTICFFIYSTFNEIKIKLSYLKTNLFLIRIRLRSNGNGSFLADLAAPM